MSFNSTLYFRSFGPQELRPVLEKVLNKTWTCLFQSIIFTIIAIIELGYDMYFNKNKREVGYINVR